MPEIIQQLFRDSPVILQWYSWGAILGLLISLGATIWIFADAQRTGKDATVWKSVAAVASVLGIPSVLARLHAAFAIEMRDSLALVAYLSILAVLLALFSAFAYTISRKQVSRCPVCGRPLEPGWSQCPYHAASTATGGEATVPISGVKPPEPLPETVAGTLEAGLSGSQGPDRGETVILKREEAPKALAFLVITSGPHAGTNLSLRDGVTRIGRDGRWNDHVIDDDAVSSEHLSIRYKDGVFVATDLDSSNGTRINGQLIVRQTLAPNDLVEIGRTRLKFVDVRDISPEGEPST